MPKLCVENHEYWEMRRHVTPQILEETLRRIALEWRGLVEDKVVDSSKCLEHNACSVCEISHLIEDVFTIHDEEEHE